MKKSNLIKMQTIGALGLLFGLVLTAPVQAGSGGTIFGSLQTARTVGQGVYNFGIGAFPADNLTTVQGSFAYGFGKYTEGRVRLGLADQGIASSNPVIAFGAEMKYQFWNYEGNTGLDDPFDLSFSGVLEYADFEGSSLTSIGANVLGSRPFFMNNGRKYGPYGRFNVRVQSINPDLGDSDSDIEFTVTPGFMIEVTRQMNAMLEVNLDDNTGVAFGVEFGPF